MHNHYNFVGRGQMIEKYLGTAYDTVKSVADALPTLTETIERLAQPAATHAPVYTSTNENITLNGQPTIDGQLVPLGERILVKDQDDTRQNGIYVVNGGDWERAVDFMDADEVLQGQIIVDRSVTAPSESTLWDVNFDTDTYEVGTSLINFSSLAVESTEKANYAALRAIVNPQHGDIYNVAGFEFLMGDSGGGKFYYNANMSRSMHNGGTIIDPTNTADLSNFDDAQQVIWFTPGAVADLGCYVRIDDTSRVKADWFGANGTNANPDSRSIQAADDVSTGTVLLPAGTLNVSGINKSPQTFWQGAGIGSIGSDYGTELALNADTYIVQVSGNGTTVAGRGGMSDMRLQGNIDAYPNSDAISIMDGARQQYLDRMYIRGFQDGLELVGTGEIYGTNLFINQCSFCIRALNLADSWFHETQVGTGFSFTGGSGYGLFMENSNAIVFSSSRFQVSPVTGARVDSCEDIKFVAPIVDQSISYGIQILDSKRVSIIDGDIFDNGDVGNDNGAGVFIGSRTGNTTEDITISGGNIYHDGTALAARRQPNGVWFSNQGNMNNIVISGTNVSKNAVTAFVNTDQVDGSLKIIDTDLPMLKADIGDAHINMLPETETTLIYDVPLTANRQVLLPVAGNYDGKVVKVIRTANATDNILFVRSNITTLVTIDSLITTGYTEFTYSSQLSQWVATGSSSGKVLDTLSDLDNTRQPNDREEFTVLGHTVIGKGGGTWYYDAADTTTTDDYNSATVYVTPQGYRFKRTNTDLNSYDFGMIGDSVTFDTDAYLKLCDYISDTGETVKIKSTPTYYNIRLGGAQYAGTLDFEDHALIRNTGNERIDFWKNSCLFAGSYFGYNVTHGMNTETNYDIEDALISAKEIVLVNAGDAADFVVGDNVYLRDPNLYGTSDFSISAHASRVVSIDTVGGIITLRDALETPMTSDGATKSVIIRATNNRPAPTTILGIPPLIKLCKDASVINGQFQSDADTFSQVVHISSDNCNFDFRYIKGSVLLGINPCSDTVIDVYEGLYHLRGFELAYFHSRVHSNYLNLVRDADPISGTSVPFTVSEYGNSYTFDRIIVNDYDYAGNLGLSAVSFFTPNNRGGSLIVNGSQNNAITFGSGVERAENTRIDNVIVNGATNRGVTVNSPDVHIGYLKVDSIPAGSMAVRVFSGVTGFTLDRADLGTESAPGSQYSITDDNGIGNENKYGDIVNFYSQPTVSIKDNVTHTGTGAFALLHNYLIPAGSSTRNAEWDMEFLADFPTTALDDKIIEVRMNAQVMGTVTIPGAEAGLATVDIKVMKPNDNLLYDFVLTVTSPSGTVTRFAESRPFSTHLADMDYQIFLSTPATSSIISKRFSVKPSFSDIV